MSRSVPPYCRATAAAISRGTTIGPVGVLTMTYGPPRTSGGAGGLVVAASEGSPPGRPAWLPSGWPAVEHEATRASAARVVPRPARARRLIPILGPYRSADSTATRYA